MGQRRWGLWVMLVVAVLVTPAWGQQVPQSRSDMAMSFSPVVKKVAPAVVDIFAARRAAPTPDMLMRQFMMPGAGVPQAVQRSEGAGVIVESSGLVVTNDHVINGAQAIQVVLSDKRRYPARIVGRDPRADLAVLQVLNAGRLPTVSFGNSKALEVGDLVLAVGNPFGVGQTVTSGIVSAMGRTPIDRAGRYHYIQTDAPINPGNSGGALVNMKGQLVGINTAIISRTGQSTGVGLAIPSNLVRTVVDRLTRGQHTAQTTPPHTPSPQAAPPQTPPPPEAAAPSRPARHRGLWLGITVQDVGPRAARRLGLPQPGGIYLQALAPDGDARRAGLRQGDVLLAVNGAPLRHTGDLKTQLDRATRTGQPVRLTAQRGRRQFTVTVNQGAGGAQARRGGGQPSVTFVPPKPQAVPGPSPHTGAPGNGPAEVTLQGGGPLRGATISTMTPPLNRQLGLPPAMKGAVVTGIMARTPAARAGLRPGDMLLSVNGQPVASAGQVQTLVQRGANGWRVQVRRRGRTLSFGG